MLDRMWRQACRNDAQSASEPKRHVTNSNEDTQSVSAETNENGDETLTVWCWDPTFNVYAMEAGREGLSGETIQTSKLDIQEKVYSDIETKLDHSC
ncbi:MAG: hypothetical protein ACLVCH_12460 [Roseburia inulinivorans]